VQFSATRESLATLVFAPASEEGCLDGPGWRDARWWFRRRIVGMEFGRRVYVSFVGMKRDTEIGDCTRRFKGRRFVLGSCDEEEDDGCGSEVGGGEEKY
jgi:hypothetical protein